MVSIFANGHKLIDDSAWSNTTVGTNLWAVSQVKAGYIANADGKQYDDGNDISIIVPLSNTSKFVFTLFDLPFSNNDNNQKCIFYDSNKKILSRQALLSGINSIPTSAKYLGISINLASLDSAYQANSQMQWVKKHKIKLELGSIATQWSPAPTDLVTQSDLDDLKAQIEQLKSK